VINPSTDKKEPNDVPVGSYPVDIAGVVNGKIYVANSVSNTISVINATTHKNTGGG
jgi:DNA-binding beta-propeller fold protein YncE